jgi:hypothetical protein
VFLFVCLLASLLVCLVFVLLFVCLCVCLFVWLFVCSIVVFKLKRITIYHGSGSDWQASGATGAVTLVQKLCVLYAWCVC